ncbi:hypothetical protein BTJ40_06945 [Microbulbifer sp. A4B17]|uniref:hypothetical protein n=1 Tax=Microbulbifer sp. A4B17 TaxID=359370 RepID=UPI000D52D29D|nr:hypothetical protein [Microbulbifer sp. A4B17]AWF80565.1 hypothetical protein BTJ40_06945 [Microbulbifer sp. A4B17]
MSDNSASSVDLAAIFYAPLNTVANADFMIVGQFVQYISESGDSEPGQSTYYRKYVILDVAPTEAIAEGSGGSGSSTSLDVNICVYRNMHRADIPSGKRRLLFLLMFSLLIETSFIYQLT